MDLSNLNIADLRDLQESVKRELEKRERQELVDAREKILAIAKSVGVSVSDLVGSGVRERKSLSVAVQYRNPEDASQQWTGRGLQPKWVKAWLETGKSLDMLRV